jgi:hypothetical protein
VNGYVGETTAAEVIIAAGLISRRPHVETTGVNGRICQIAISPAALGTEIVRREGEEKAGNCPGVTLKVS